MFKQARQNSFIYILTKGINPILETGVIQSVSQPRLGQMPQQPQPYQFPQPMVVDIVATVGSERRNLNGLPSENDIADYMGNVVVTTDKEKIANEIKALHKEQENIVNGHDRAKELMGIYSGMLTSLNPEEAEKKAQADKLASLENAYLQQCKLNEQMMKQQEQMMQQMQMMMSSMSGGSNTKPSKNKQENA